MWDGELFECWGYEYGGFAEGESGDGGEGKGKLGSGRWDGGCGVVVGDLERDFRREEKQKKRSSCIYSETGD